jgi:hypothetical protein
MLCFVSGFAFGFSCGKCTVSCLGSRQGEGAPVGSGKETPRGDGGAPGVNMSFAIKISVSRLAKAPKIRMWNTVRSGG